MAARHHLLALAAALALGLGAAACDGVPQELQPDQMLRDSLGLGDGDAVWTVRLTAPDNRERAEPDELRVTPDDWIQFVTGDGRLHMVRFAVDSLPTAAADFLVGSGQDASPPLIEEGSRFLVHFQDAPPGRYPFVVEGSGAAGRGMVVVEAER